MATLPLLVTIPSLTGLSLPVQASDQVIVGRGSIAYKATPDDLFSLSTSFAVSSGGVLNLVGGTAVAITAPILSITVAAVNFSGDLTIIGDVDVDGTVAADLIQSPTITSASTLDVSAPGTLSISALGMDITSGAAFALESVGATTISSTTGQITLTARGRLSLISETLNVSIGAGVVPLTANAQGNPGDVAWNSTHFFVCVAFDTWKRVALSTW